MKTEAEVLQVLKTHHIRNSESLVTDLGLKGNIDVRAFDPYPFQLTKITEILNAIIEKGYRIIVLNLPTGSGKSYISAALSILLDYYEIAKITPTTKSFALTFRNNLFSQYEKSFKYMYSIKGKSNYTCLLDYNKINSKTLCIKEGSKACTSRHMCEYFLQKSNFYKSKSLITNYNWYIFNFHSLTISDFTSTLIMDEVHTVFDIIDGIFTIDHEKMHKVFEPLYKFMMKDDGYATSPIKLAIDNKRYSEATEHAKRFIEIIYTESALTHFIDDFIKVKDELALLCILENYRVPVGMSKGDTVKYVFDIISSLHNPMKVKIFMSATVTKEFFFDNLYSGDPDKVFYLSMDPIFKKENRQIYSFKSLPSVNYERLQDEKFRESWLRLIDLCVKHHKDVKGFVYVNSYTQVKLLKNKFMNDPRFIFNDYSGNAKTTLQRFMEDKTNKVYVSPNLQEGYSFDDDISRFQIIAKIPFVDHKLIAEYGGAYYYNKTVIALLQTYGRSIRSEKDYASTYLIDNSWKQLDKHLPQWFKDSIIEK